MNQFFILTVLSLEISTFCNAFDHSILRTNCDDCQYITSTTTFETDFNGTSEHDEPKASTFMAKFISKNETHSTHYEAVEVKETTMEMMTSKPFNLSTSILNTKLKLKIKTSTEALNVPKRSSSDDEIRKIIFIVMIFIVVILLFISALLLFCIRKYRAKNRKSIRALKY